MAALPPHTHPRTVERVAAFVEDLTFIVVLVSAVALAAAILVLAFAL